MWSTGNLYTKLSFPFSLHITSFRLSPFFFLFIYTPIWNWLRNWRYFLSPKQDYDAQDLQEFENSILAGCDYNKDGKINKKELTMILLALSKHASEEEEALERRRLSK